MDPPDALPVFYGETRVGTLFRPPDQTLAFAYDEHWRKHGFAISASLPLKSGEGRSSGAFFENLLPEGDVRTLVARRLGVSQGNDFELLRALGGDCAGALSLGEPGAPEHDYDELTPTDLLAWMDAGTPALSQTVGRAGTRLSLAGAQDKLPVRIEGTRFYLPRGRAASTHILKLDNRYFKHLPDNELLITRFAAALGLPTCNVHVRHLGRRRIFAIERYDREVGAAGQVHRLHQEDMCQALGLPPARKYQSEGGPRFEACYVVVAQHSREPLPDAQALLRWIAFCALSGNADGHAKNLSMVRSKDGGWRLSPFYDLVCTGVYPRISKSLAMSVGPSSDPCFIRGKDWEELAKHIGASPRFVKRLVGELCDRAAQVFEQVAAQVVEELGKSPIVQPVRQRIRKNARSLQARFHE